MRLIASLRRETGKGSRGYGSPRALAHEQQLSSFSSLCINSIITIGNAVQ